MLIEDTKFAASELLVNNFALADVEKFGKNLVMNTIKESADEIAWHTQAILKHGDNPEPLVLLRAHRKAAFKMLCKSLFIHVTNLTCLLLLLLFLD